MLTCIIMNIIICISIIYWRFHIRGGFLCTGGFTLEVVFYVPLGLQNISSEVALAVRQKRLQESHMLHFSNQHSTNKESFTVLTEDYKSVNVQTNSSHPKRVVDIGLHLPLTWRVMNFRTPC